MSFKHSFILLLITTYSLANSITNIDQLNLIDELKYEKLINQQQYLHMKNLVLSSTPLPNRKALGGTATIQGHVQDVSTTPLMGQTISIQELVLGVRTQIGTVSTDASGNYMFNNLTAGTYLVFQGRFDDDYLNYMWGSPANTVCTKYQCLDSTSNQIVLADAATISGIDFTPALGGKITGTITDAITNANVDTLTANIINTDINAEYYFLSRNVINVPSGTYSIKGIPDGNYKIYLENTQSSIAVIKNIHTPKIYGGPECYDCRRIIRNDIGTVLTINSGNTLNNIDLPVNVGASIGGKLVDGTSSNPMTNNGAIFLFDANNTNVGLSIVFGTDFDANADGTYFIGGLLPGDYYVQGGGIGFHMYQRELYSNRPCYYGGCDRSIGDSVTLAPKENKFNIDFLLELGGKISGTVTDQLTGTPLTTAPAQRILVEFLDAQEKVKGSAYIAADGTYQAAHGLPAGNYSVRTGSMFEGDLTKPYVNKNYLDIPCAGLACDFSTPGVAVVNGAITSNIDFSLTMGNSFSGTITDLATSAPIAGVSVLVYKDMGAGVVKFANWATSSDGLAGNPPIGTFEVSGLPDGTYYARTGYGSDLPFFISSFINIGGTAPTGWIDILYDNMPCMSNCDVTLGTAIVLPFVIKKNAVGKSSDGTVNFALNQGAIITGRVTDFIQNGPLGDITINVYSAAGVFMGSSVSNAQGDYITRGLPAGFYYLTTSSLDVLLDVKYGNQFCFPITCNPLFAQPVILSNQETKVNIDFKLKTAYMHVFSDGFD